MRLPWVSRSAHEAMMDLLQAQIAEMKTERLVLYDRLGSIGLGGPLFAKPEIPEQEPEAEPEPADPETEMRNRLLALRHRPSKLRAEVRRQALNEHTKRFAPPSVARIPDAAAVARVTAAMDAAEAQGRKQA